MTNEFWPFELIIKCGQITKGIHENYFVFIPKIDFICMLKCWKVNGTENDSGRHLMTLLLSSQISHLAAKDRAKHWTVIH